jgi:hypothetical protein
MSDWENDESPDALDAIRWEVNCLWSDLNDATRQAVNGSWSMACDDIASRIVGLGRFVGALPWEHVQVDLLRSGVYERVYRGAGLEYEPIDWDRVAEVHAYIERGGQPNGYPR